MNTGTTTYTAVLPGFSGITKPCQLSAVVEKLLPKRNKILVVMSVFAGMLLVP